MRLCLDCDCASEETVGGCWNCGGLRFQRSYLSALSLFARTTLADLLGEAPVDA
jgi:hypothetical protein